MNSFKALLMEEKKKPYFKTLEKNIFEDRNSGNVYPKEEDVYKAIELCELDQVKVVIIGQDPYHGKNQANGLAFSVNQGEKLPPSLKNIYKEIETSSIYSMGTNGDLTSWAKQGVLLLNTILTVKEGQPLSHKDYGWQTFTNEIIHLINEKKHHVVYLLFGAHAKTYANMIDQSKNYIFYAPHPSPLSAYRGFIGSHVFELANHVLENLGLGTIDWQII
ncbi:Uracil-DNA glycosylase [Paracholeplasma brassicae]|uniref:Uracil-DNA glycosylase n=1 Tax=Acholeplasma brassicae TaxID=61635 RepID=U4KTA8_9MOLU|nr:uracil-DNA glycosylase [Paracholeplasma brassicae]CCV66364.1 Uracil-DNA glycosylase [Paracholeplasma brassicae]